jgi:microcystin-dependent protein
MTNLQDFTNRSEVGAIKPWGKTTAPVGYVLCDGTAISRTTYAELFTVIGTTYGAGDTSTTFNVPNLQGKTPQGYDGSTYNLAATGGANTVTVAVTNNQAASSTDTLAVSVTGSIDNTSLTTAQLASHGHGLPLNGPYSPTVTWGWTGGGNKNITPSGTSYSAGSGTGHNHSHTLSGTLTGNITTSLSGSVTAAGTNSFSPYVVVNYIIKH